jgi:hypothetical protein
MIKILKRHKIETKFRKKRSLNGQQLQLYVEYFMISDSTIFDKFSNLLNTSNNNIVIQYLQIYYVQLVNAINQRYFITFQNDQDLMISVSLVGILIETVGVYLKYNFKIQA